MAFRVVVDTSAVLAAVLSEPAATGVVAATRGATILAAPSLPWEIGNALVALVRRGMAGAAEAQRGWDVFLRVPLRYVEIDGSAAIRLAVQTGLHAYDAYVLEAARASRAPLLSLDRRQCRAARTLGIAVVEVAG